MLYRYTNCRKSIQLKQFRTPYIRINNMRKYRNIAFVIFSLMLSMVRKWTLSRFMAISNNLQKWVKWRIPKKLKKCLNFSNKCWISRGWISMDKSMEKRLSSNQRTKRHNPTTLFNRKRFQKTVTKCKWKKWRINLLKSLIRKVIENKVIQSQIAIIKKKIKSSCNKLLKDWMKALNKPLLFQNKKLRCRLLMLIAIGICLTIIHPPSFNRSTLKEMPFCRSQTKKDKKRLGKRLIKTLSTLSIKTVKSSLKSLFQEVSFFRFLLN